MSQTHGNDRRRDSRIGAIGPAKVYDYKARRYRAAQTVNLSAGGALLELLQPAHFHDGDRVDVAIDPTGSMPVIAHSDMRPAYVVRQANQGLTTPRIAVRFASRIDLPQAA